MTKSSLKKNFVKNLSSLKRSIQDYFLGEVIFVLKEGMAYEVVSFNEDLTTAGGTKLKAVSVKSTYSVIDFGAVGDGVTDDTDALETAIAASSGSDSLIFPRGTYRFTRPLVIEDINVDFGKSVLLYDGPSGDFALTLASSSGGGSDQTTGNRFANLTLRQEDWSEYVTFSGSKVYDPPSLASGANITNITPNAHSTTVTVAGARAGGYARATFSELVDGVALSAAVTADDEVTVYFNNYVSSAINMGSGTLSVEVVNNAYHGICLGGGLGRLEGAKIIGFTGVSLALGDGTDQITGVDFPGIRQCYYWNIHANVAPAAGWGVVVRPRNNENILNLSLFPINAFDEAEPRRACCINQVVMSGIANSFEALSLESVSSEEALLITHAANTITSSKVVYYESNLSWVEPPAPYIRAETYSSGCSMQIRTQGDLDAILDEGYANDIQRVMAFYLNGAAMLQPEGGNNFVFNGDFLNGTNGWDNWSSGSPVVTVPGAGYLSGNRARVDITGGKVNLQQSVDLVGPILMEGLSGKTVTAGAWIKTNMTGMCIRANGTSNPPVPNDEQWYFSSVTYKQSDTDFDIQITDKNNSNQTGYVEISNVTCTLGRRAVPINVPTMPTGSVAYNPPSLASGSQDSVTLTVEGAAFGDFVIPAFTRDLVGLQLTGYVSSTDTVTIILCNNSGTTRDIGSGTLSARLLKK